MHLFYKSSSMAAGTLVSFVYDFLICPSFIIIVLADLTILDFDNLMYHILNCRIMGDNQHGSTVFLVDIFQKYQDISGGFGVKSSRWFIA